MEQRGRRKDREKEGRGKGEEKREGRKRQGKGGGKETTPPSAIKISVYTTESTPVIYITPPKPQ